MQSWSMILEKFPKDQARSNVRGTIAFNPSPSRSSRAIPKACGVDAGGTPGFHKTITLRSNLVAVG
jgi:hypothetical protein